MYSAIGGEIQSSHILRIERRGGTSLAEVKNTGIAVSNHGLKHETRWMFRGKLDQIRGDAEFFDAVNNTGSKGIVA